MSRTSRDHLKDVHTVVLKLGTGTVINPNGTFNNAFVQELVAQITELRKEGKQFVIVSSGAIGLGNHHLRWEKKHDLVLNQCSASVGQTLLMNAYSGCFKKSGIVISQLLVTHENMNDEHKQETVRRLITKTLELGIIPIINENDSVSTEEITFGDNDLLSAYVANLIEADLLAMISDVKGLYRNSETKEVVPIITTIDQEVKKWVNPSVSSGGKGGMSSKLLAAQIAADTKTMTIVASSAEKDVLKRIIKGEEVGTFFSLDGHNKSDYRLKEAAQ